MMNMKRIFSVMLVLLLALCMGISSFAAVATPDEVATEAGKQVEVKFELGKVAAVNGTFTFSNDAMISGVDVTCSGLTMGHYNPDNNMIAYYGDAGAVDCVITVTLTVADTAKAGDETMVNFTYETSDELYFPETPVFQELTACVYIAGSEDGLDYSALKATIKTAEGLTEEAYTADSWAAMIAVLEDAKALVDNAETQDEIDAMTAKLQAAIDALVPIIPPSGDMIVLAVAAMAVAMAGAVVFFNKRRVAVK